MKNKRLTWATIGTALDQLAATDRYLIACFRALGLVQTTKNEKNEDVTSFVNPETFKSLPLLDALAAAGFFGRLWWLLTGRF